MHASPPEGYLDAVGGQPMLPAARSALAAAADQAWADPAAIHHAGRRARLLLESARASIATSLAGLGQAQVRAEDVWFASSVQAARRAALAGVPGPLAVNAIDPLDLLELGAGRAQVVGVDARGRASVDDWGALARPPALACLQAANPEVGTLQPVAEVAALGMPVLMDATQAISRSLLPDGWALATAAAADWGGPAGVAILVSRPGSPWQRPPGLPTAWVDGAPDVAAAVAAAMALEACVPAWRAEADRARAAIDAIRAAAGAVPDVEVVGDPRERLPHVATFSALYVAGEALVSAFDRHGLAVASGSACLQADRPSHVLAAMGAFTGGNVRVSLPFGFAEATVERFVAVLPEVIAATRREVLGD